MQRLYKLICLLLIFPMTLSQAQDGEEALFTVYRDEESLTIVFTGTGEVAFHDIRINVIRPGDEPDKNIYLEDYILFEPLNFALLELPTCLRFEWEDTELSLPSVCNQLSSRDLQIENGIGLSDIFWYERRTRRYFNLSFFQGNTEIGNCRADQGEDEVCEVTFTPQPMSEYLPPTPRPTTPPAPMQPTATQTVSARTYPCPAQVDPNSMSSILNVVRQSPNSTTVIASVRRGDQVTIIERSAGANVFYQIQSGGRTIGWIAAQYLALSATCPA